MTNNLNKVDDAIERAFTIHSIHNLRYRIGIPLTRKKDQEFTVYDRVMNMVKKNTSNDKVFPLETVYLNQNSTISNSVSKTANIHIGPYADDLAFSINALAFAVGYDIYFRGGKYQPETEEGRKIIAHELKHIEQHHEKRISLNTDIEDLEKEAEIAENMEEYESDPYNVYIINNKRFRFRRSQIKKIIKNAADGVEQWLAEQKYVCSEDDYMNLLHAYSNWLEEI